MLGDTVALAPESGWSGHPLPDASRPTLVINEFSVVITFRQLKESQ